MRGAWPVLALVALQPAIAQLPIAPKAGLIYLVEDKILLDGRPLPGLTATHMARVGKGHELTVVRGRAELLLQPLAFLRLAPGAAASMLADDLADVRLRIQGAAILDVHAIERGSLITLNCAESSIAVAKPGVYRVECRDRSAASTLRVYQGAATVDTNPPRYLKTGQAVTLDPGAPVRTFDRKALDAFDLWSAERTDRVRGFTRTGKRSPSTAADPTYTDPEDIRKVVEGPIR